MAKKKGKSLVSFAKEVDIKNRKAYFDYEILEKYEAGIYLVGSEIKSIRMGSVSLADSYCIFATPNELCMKNTYIANYGFSNAFDKFDEHRDRKILLTKKELRKLREASIIPGNTIVPLRMFTNDKGRVKIEIGLCRGKKQYDKRASIKDKDMKRELERTINI
jgi:SsrA-binding protein